MEELKSKNLSFYREDIWQVINNHQDDNVTSIEQQVGHVT